MRRAENTDEPSRLRSIFGGPLRIAEDLPVVLPLHPRTRSVLTREGLLSQAETSLCIIPPAGYLDMILLEKSARLVATDSGGVPKEAYFCQVPSVIFRKETKWVELVELGWTVVVEPLSESDVTRVVSTHVGARGSNQHHPSGNGGRRKRS